MNVLRVLLFFGLSALLFIVGCKDEESTQAKKPAGEVTIRLNVEPNGLSPLITLSGYSRYVYEQIFLPLLRYDPESLEMMPALALAAPETAKVTEGPYAGGRSFTYQLHPEAKWNDGPPVTVDDLVFSLKVLFNPKIPADVYRGYYSMIQDVEVDPDSPGKFTIYTDSDYFISEAALSSFIVYPKHIFDAGGLMEDIELSQLTDPDSAAELGDTDENLARFAEQFMSPDYVRSPEKIKGNGPYNLVEWEAGQKIVLERVDNWWADALADRSDVLVAYPQKLIYRFISDQTAAINALKSQEIDVASSINALEFAKLQSDPTINKHYNLHTPKALQGYYIGFNTRREKLADKRVRRAIAHLLDIDALIEEQFAGLGDRLAVPFDPTKPYYNKDLPLLEFDIDQARTLLQEAGWADTNGNGTVDKVIDGQLTELELQLKVASQSKFAQNLAVLMQENARRAGVDIQPDIKEHRTILGEVRNLEFDLFSSGFGFSPEDQDPLQLWHTNSAAPGGGNRPGFGNAESDAIIDELRYTLDDKRKGELYEQLQAMIYEEQPMITLFAPRERIVIHKRFKATPSVMNPGYFPQYFELDEAYQAATTEE